MDFLIGEFSKITGVSIYTLRYYEKEKLIIPTRSANGRRCYSEKDVIWMQFITRLKNTHMPIREIRRYADLRAKGDSTLAERLEMLTEHRADLINEIAILQSYLQNLDEKIEAYQTQINRQGKTTRLPEGNS
jgi:DNA-binding transcriptional MerR regulator